MIIPVMARYFKNKALVQTPILYLTLRLHLHGITQRNDETQAAAAAVNFRYQVRARSTRRRKRTSMRRYVCTYTKPKAQTKQQYSSHSIERTIVGDVLYHILIQGNSRNRRHGMGLLGVRRMSDTLRYAVGGRDDEEDIDRLKWRNRLRMENLWPEEGQPGNILGFRDAVAAGIRAPSRGSWRHSRQSSSSCT